MSLRDAVKRRLIDRRTSELMDAMPIHTGPRGGFDPWGFNLESAKAGMGFSKLLYEKYFRVQAHGLEHIPKKGRALVIANHAGQLPMDGMMVGYALATNPHGPRAPRAMIERFFPTVPYLGNWLNSVGAVIGDPANCIKMLNRDEVVIVFPEGIRGSGKPYKLRYQLQRFGTGFMHIAMETNTPIVPVGVVGSEESMPSLGNFKPLARLLGIPYVPIGPPLPLPARMYLNFGKPMHYRGDVENEAQVTEQVREVKAEIRKLIETGLKGREKVY